MSKEQNKNLEENKQKDEKKTEGKNQLKEEKLENLKQEDLIVKYTEEIKLFKKNINEKNKEIDHICDQIKEKEKKISDYSHKNKKLHSQLEQLKSELDHKLNHIETRKIGEIEYIKKIKSSSYEKILLIREKELKNVTNFIKILKKDKENLEKNLQERTDIGKILEFENKIENLNKENTQLINEIHYFKRLNEQHRICPEHIKSCENDLKLLNEEIHHLKFKENGLKRKLSIESNSRNKTNSKLENILNAVVYQKTECSNLLNNMKVIEKKKSISIIGLKNANTESKPQGNYQPYFEQYNPSKQVELMKKEKKRQNKKLFAKDDTNITKFNKNQDKNSIQSEYLSKSLALNHIERESEIKNLFNEKERKYLIKLYPQKQVEKFESSFHISEKLRVNGYQQYKKEMNESSNEITILKESIHLKSLEVKEIEQKNKLYIFQLNELKNEQSLMNKKIEETKEKVIYVNSKLKEKGNENNILHLQVLNLNKLQKEYQEREIRESSLKKY